MHPILFNIGTFAVHSFGVMMVLAFFGGLWLANRRAAKYGVPKNEVMDMVFWTLISGVLGARIVFILQEWHYYFVEHREQLFTLKFEGLTSFGALIFGFFAIVIFARIKKRPLLAILDILGPALLLGQAVGRIGCLLNGCCYGGVCPTDAWYGIHIQNMGELKFYPAQLIDSAMNLVGLVAVLFLEKRGLKAGQVFGAAVAAHGISRFIYEFWRAGTADQVAKGLASSTYMANLPITDAQVAAGGLIILGVVSFLVFGNRARARARAETGQLPA